MKCIRLFVIGLVLLSSGCTNFWITESDNSVQNSDQRRGEPFQSSANAAAREQQRTPPPAPAVTPDVLVIWAIPTSAVDRYTIRYGFTRESLSESVTVTTDALEKYQDPVHGFVYKYVLKGVPEDRSVFVSLTAHTGSESSPPSATFEIPAR